MLTVLLIALVVVLALAGIAGVCCLLTGSAFNGVCIGHLVGTILQGAAAVIASLLSQK